LARQNTQHHIIAPIALAAIVCHLGGTGGNEWVVVDPILHINSFSNVAIAHMSQYSITNTHKLFIDASLRTPIIKSFCIERDRIVVPFIYEPKEL
jgi:hypothetical protein